MSSKHVLVKKREYASLKEDKLRLDYMEKVVARGYVKLFGVKVTLPSLEGDSTELRQTLDRMRFRDKDF